MARHSCVTVSSAALSNVLSNFTLPPLPTRGSMVAEAIAIGARELGAKARAAAAQSSAPDEAEDWLREMFPAHVKHPFGDRHHEFWRWAWNIELASAPDPFVGVWPRGGAKSTSAELACAALGLRGRRRYALYVRDTQDRADDSVSNIASLLESGTVEHYYPAHARPLVGKHGNSRGWRRNRLRTEGGFTIDAIGLDTAARGVKMDDQRPDLIIFDDIDGKLDSPATTARKIAILTTSILPTGAGNVAVLGIQNLITPDGIFSQLVDGRADFLVERLVSGPYPAVEELATELQEDKASGTVKAVIVAGTATWAGQDLAACQRLIDTIGLGAFLLECQHEVHGHAEGLALRFREQHHLEDLDDEHARALVKLGSVIAGCDFGSWRFGVELTAVDRAGVPHQIAEYFSQRESLERRAICIHSIFTHYGVSPKVRIYGDSANPTDINELNANFRRVGSPYRAVPVASENKIRLTSVERLNELLDRRALRFRRDVHRHVARIDIRDPRTEKLLEPISPIWRLGYGAARPGVELQGSRLLWEIKHWKYPIAKAGYAQKQDPDDNTADGADLISAKRYQIMSWWKAPKEPEPEERSAFHPDVLKEDAERSRTIKHRISRKRQHKPTDDHFGGY